MGKVRLYTTWISLALFFALVMIVRVSPGVMADDIMRHFFIGATEFGLMTSLYYLGYSSMQIPIGFLLDRYGPRYVATIGVLLCGLGCFLFAKTDHWAIALFARFLIGVGSSGAFISVTKFIRLHFAEHLLSPLIGLSITIGLLGAFGGGKPVSILSHNMGWHMVMMLFVVIALALALVIFTLVKPPKPIVRETKPVFCLKGLRSTLREQNILWIALCGMALTGPFCAFADVFGVSYFMYTQGWERAQAAEVTTTIYIGMAVGGPLLGALVNRFRCPLDFVALSGLAMLIVFGLILSLDLSYMLGLCLCFILGIFCGFQVLIFGITLMKTPSHQGGIMMGIVNSINMVSGQIYLPFVGKMLDVFWEGGMADGIKTYSAWAYKMSMLPILGGLVIGTAGLTILCLLERRSARAVSAPLILS